MFAHSLRSQVAYPSSSQWFSNDKVLHSAQTPESWTKDDSENTFAHNKSGLQLAAFQEFFKSRCSSFLLTEVFRGCADPWNLPWGVDINNNCKQQYDKSVWWFCDGEVCNHGQIDDKDRSGFFFARHLPK